MRTHNIYILFILFLSSSFVLKGQAYIEMTVSTAYCSPTSGPNESTVCSPAKGCLDVTLSNSSSPQASYRFTGTITLRRKTGNFSYQTEDVLDAGGIYANQTFTFDDISTPGEYAVLVSLTHDPLGGGQQFDVKEKYNCCIGQYNYTGQTHRHFVIKVPASADFLINGSTPNQSSVNFFCPNSSLTMNGAVSGGSNDSGDNYEHRIYYRFANSSGVGLGAKFYSNGGAWTNGKPSNSIDLKSLFPVFNSAGDYRVGIEVRNTCNSSNTDEKSIWVQINADDFDILGSVAGNPDPVTLNMGGSCTSISNVVCGQFQTSFTFSGQNNNNFPIDQYKFLIIKYSNSCGSEGVYPSGWINPSANFIDDLIFNVGQSILLDGGSVSQANQLTEANHRYRIILTIDAGDCSLTKDFWIDNSGSCKKATETTTDLVYGLNTYPNPLEDKLNMRFFTNEHLDGLTVNIYDAMGRLVKQVEDNNFRFQGLQNVDLDLGSLDSGIYYYELLTGGQAWKGKLLKAK